MHQGETWLGEEGAAWPVSPSAPLTSSFGHCLVIGHQVRKVLGILAWALKGLSPPADLASLLSYPALSAPTAELFLVPPSPTKEQEKPVIQRKASRHTHPSSGYEKSASSSGSAHLENSLFLGSCSCVQSGSGSLRVGMGTRSLGKCQAWSLKIACFSLGEHNLPVPVC